MNHHDATTKLSAYHDRELTPELTAQIERHVDACTECRGELAHLQNISAIIAPLTGNENTELFVQRVMARLPERSPSFWKTFSGWWRIPALAMTALLIVSTGSGRTDSVPSTSSLLCGDNISTAVKHLCSDDTEHSDELMNLVWGDL